MAKTKHLCKNEALIQYLTIQMVQPGQFRTRTKISKIKVGGLNFLAPTSYTSSPFSPPPLHLVFLLYSLNHGNAMER